MPNDIESPLVYIGIKTYVCVTISPLKWDGNTTYIHMNSELISDNFNSININNSWTSKNYNDDSLISKLPNIEESNGIGVSISSMGLMSYQKVYRSFISKDSSNYYSNTITNSSVTFPILMVVINVDQGIVKVNILLYILY
jgi:uncharacterized surface anchored protein